MLTFNQGLNVNIEAPEYETSIKILEMEIANNVSQYAILMDGQKYSEFIFLSAASGENS